MKQRPVHRLSRRERQIMEILYSAGHATVAEVLGYLPDPPSYSSVRALLAVLEKKGYVCHRNQGKAYRFSPTVSRARASRSALKNVVQTFFDGSIESVVAALMSMKSTRITDEEYDRLARLIERKRRQVKEKRCYD